MSDGRRASAECGQQVDYCVHRVTRRLFGSDPTSLGHREGIPNLRQPLQELLDQALLCNRSGVLAAPYKPVCQGHKTLHGWLRYLGVLIGEQDRERGHTALHGSVLGLHPRNETSDHVHAGTHGVLVKALAMLDQHDHDGGQTSGIKYFVRLPGTTEF